MTERCSEILLEADVGWLCAEDIAHKLTEVDAMLMYLEVEADDLSSDMVALLQCARRILRQVRQARRPS